MKLIVRADDLGYSEAVNYGIFKSAKDGIINNISIMINMEHAKHGYQLIKNLDVSLGLHVNISSGNPISELNKIPSLVNGKIFKDSKTYNNNKVDTVVLEEAIIEIQNQVDLFMKIVGYYPKYIDFHAVLSNNFILAAEMIAKKNNISFIGLNTDKEVFLINGKYLNIQIANGDTKQKLLNSFKSIINGIQPQITDLIVYHPGFIDVDLLEKSTLAIKRAYDTLFLTSSDLKDYISEKNIELLKLESFLK